MTRQVAIIRQSYRLTNWSGMTAFVCDASPFCPEAKQGSLHTLGAERPPGG